MWVDGSGTWSFLVALTCVTATAKSAHHNVGVESIFVNRESITDFECKEEGYAADPRDCKIYYRCVDWGQSGKLTKFKFECGPGTVFSKERGDICTHPNESGRLECGGSDNDDKTNDVDSNDAYEPANSRPDYPRPTHGPSSVPSSGPSYVPPSSLQPRPPNRPATAGTIITSKPTTRWSSQPTASTAGTWITDNTERASTQSAVGNECRENGFLADPQDCSKFYRCVDEGAGSFRKVEFKCGEGTVWDPKIEGCNHPWAANRVGCTISQPNPSQNNEDGDVPYQTGPNSDPNVASQPPPPPCRTETPPLVGGQQGTPSTSNPHEESTTGAQEPEEGSQQGSSPGNEVDQPSGTTPSSPQPTTGGSNDKPEKPDSSKPGAPPLSKNEPCKSEGFFGDAEDCSKFYRCVNSGSKFTKYEFKCGDGTVWDDRIASCNHKYAVPRCGGSDQGTGDGNQRPDETGNEIGTDQGTGDGNQRPDEMGNEIGTDQGNGNEGTGDIDNEVGPRPDSGSSPVDSTSSSPQPTSPTEGTTQSLGVDQGPVSSGGAGTTVSPGATENPSQANPPTGTTPDGSDSPSTSENPSQTENSGTGECTAEGFFPDPKDCSKFYRCVSSGSKFTKYEFQCGEGTVWDVKITSCNHKSAVPRCGGVDQGPGGENQRPDETENEIGSEPGTGDGNKVPDETTNEVGQGPESGSSPVNPDSSSGQPPNPTGSEATPVESGSSSGQPPSPTTATTESSIFTGGSPNPEESSTIASSSTEAAGESEGSEPSTSEKPSPGGPLENGQCTKEGFFSDPENCKKFYRCVAEGSKLTKYEFTCGEGTAWDDKIQSCNHAYAVPGCGEKAGDTGGQSPDGNSPSDGSPGDNGEGGQGGASESPELSSSEPPTTGSNEPTSSENPASPEEESQEPPATTQASEVSSEASPAGENETPGESSSTIPPSSQPSENTPLTEESEQPIESSSTAEPSSQSPEETTPTSEAEPSSESSSTTSSSGQSSEAVTPENGDQPPTEASSTAEPSDPSSMAGNEIPNEPQTTSTPSISTSQPPQSTTGQSNGNGQSGSSGECNSEGFFPNKNDCHKFYRCVAGGRGGYTKYEFSCGPGTAWDQNLLTCNHEHLVPSCNADSTNEIIDEKEEGNPSTTSAPGSSSSVEKPGAGSPNEPPSTESNVPSSGKPAEVTKPVESSSESSSESTSESSSGSSESSSMTTSSGSSTEPGRPCDKPKPTGIVCNEAGFNPHPTRCDKFYRCVDNGNGFNVYHFDCPPGTIFDPSISVCNYPESVYPERDCQNGGTPGGSTESSGGPGSSTESSGSPLTGPTSTESLGTTGKVEEVPTSTEAAGESTSEESGSEAPGETTESAGSEGTTEASGESSEAPQTTVDQEESMEPTSTESEATTESQEPLTTESAEQPTTEAAEQPTTEAAEQPTTEAGELPTTAAGEQPTTETQEQMTENSPETTTTTDSEETTSVSNESGESTTQKIPPGASPCPLGDLSGEQIVLVCPTGFRRHPKYCNIFYQCISEATMEVKILSFSCPENTIFDESKIQCLPESESSQACTGVKAGARFYRRIESSSTALMKVEKRETLCPDVGHYPYREGCSNVFYKCKRDTRDALQGYVYKCPQDFVYWSVSRRCERASRLPMCTSRYSSIRDQAENESYSSRWQLPIEDYNLSARMLRYPY